MSLHCNTSLSVRMPFHLSGSSPCVLACRNMDFAREQIEPLPTTPYGPPRQIGMVNKSRNCCSNSIPPYTDGTCAFGIRSTCRPMVSRHVLLNHCLHFLQYRWEMLGVYSKWSHVLQRHCDARCVFCR